MWEKVLFLRGTLRIHFKPDQRVSVGFCPFWSMIHNNSCIFENFWKIEILGYMGVEYAAYPKNAPKIFLGDNRPCSKSEGQNAENLHFSKSFENFYFQVSRASIWANSDRISKMWSILKSERSLRKLTFSSLSPDDSISIAHISEN